MIGDIGHDYGQISPANGDGESQVAGDPQFVVAPGVGSRDDARLQEHGEGSRGRTPEDEARDHLESAGGLEPPYEYMSAEGSPDRQGGNDLGENQVAGENHDQI